MREPESEDSVNIVSHPSFLTRSRRLDKSPMLHEMPERWIWGSMDTERTAESGRRHGLKKKWRHSR